MFSLAEDLTLLLLDDDSGRPIVDNTSRDRAVTGAVLLDLVSAGRVSPAGTDDDAKEGTLLVRDSSPTGDAVLDHALARLADKPVKPQRAVELLVKGTRDAVLDRLVERGLLRRESSTVLGIFRIKSWPAADQEHEAQVRARIDAVLRQGESPDPHTGGLIALVHAIGALKKVLGEDSPELRSRAKEIANANWASQAVRQAIQTVYAAVTASAAAVAAAAAAAG